MTNGGRLSAEAGDDDGHVVGLLGSAGPLFDGGEQTFGDAIDGKVAEAEDFCGEARVAKFLSIDVFRFEQTVTESHEERAGRGRHADLFVFSVIEKPNDSAALIELGDFAAVNEKRSAVAGVGVGESARRGIVFSVEESGVAIVRSVEKQMAIERLHDLRSAAMSIENRLAAQRGLQAGHQQRGGNSFAGNVGDGETEFGVADFQKIVIVAGDDARGAADGGEFKSRQRRKLAREELALDFAGDGQFVFEFLAGALLFDEFGDGAGHGVEGFGEHAELIAIADMNPMAEIALPNVAGGFVQVVHGDGDGAREDDAGDERSDFQGEEKKSDEDEGEDHGVADDAEGSEEAVIQIPGTHGKCGDDRNGGGGGLLVVGESGVESGVAGNFEVVPAVLGAEHAGVGDLRGADEALSAEIENLGGGIGICGRAKCGELHGAEVGRERSEEICSDGDADEKFVGEG